MQGVAISKIPGALVANCDVNFSEPWKNGYNQCRSEMSKVKIGLKREDIDDLFSKLPNYDDTQIFEEVIWSMFQEAIKTGNKEVIIKAFQFSVRKTHAECRDAILQALPDLLTVVKEGT